MIKTVMKRKLKKETPNMIEGNIKNKLKTFNY